jgi:hypothetical protein
MQETQETQDSGLPSTGDHEYGQLSQIQGMMGPRTSTQIPRQVYDVPDMEDQVENLLRAEPHEQATFPRKVRCIKCCQSVRVETAESLCNYCGYHPQYM